MHIKKTTVLLFSVLFLTFASLVSANEAIVKTDNLNVRTGPGTNFDKIGQVHTDEVYPILQQQEGWVEIQLTEGTGWVTNEYIDISGNTDSESTNESDMEPATEETITIQHDNTQLREGPSTSYDITDFANKGTEFKVLSESNEWYEIENDDITGYVFKQLVKKERTSSFGGMNGKTIVIDAGHGGRDVGAIGASGTYEKDFTYKTSQELKQELTALGANVVLTRKSDEFISLGSRTSLPNILDTDAFISIHYNSFPEMPNVTGIGAYFYDDQNEKLAKDVLQGIAKETGARNRGATFGDFHVIRQTFKPSILVELGFISNPEKEQLLQTNAYQKKLVTGIVNGLNQYFTNK
ncbi:N-acetylmuramoyl-L-alanine amidase [Virgibacillus sp. JSM 102003]|uniref:N-acetylmuramoyl-L-alanine amidase n=1 Tax=Virgibacillus sp. JSM 102003 TaxID=1562108 RepID=UPI0035BF29BC